MQGQKPIAPQLQSFNTRVNDINLDSRLREFGPQLGSGAYGATITAHVTAAGARQRATVVAISITALSV